MNSNCIYKKIISDLEEKINQLQKKGQEAVFNQKLKEVEPQNINYIWVGDNPGSSEKEKNAYLVEDKTKISSAGNNANRLFSHMGITNSSIVLNKTPIYTDSTQDLKKLKGNKNFKETQEFMAEITFCLHKTISKLNSNCEVFIFGFSGCYDLDKKWLSKKKDNSYYANQYLPYYFETLRDKYRKNKTLRNKLNIIRHFSYWRIFDDFSFEIENYDDKLLKNEKVTMNKIEEYCISKKEIINAFKRLNYSEELFN